MRSQRRDLGYVTAIITERGVARGPYEQSLRAMTRV